MAELYQTGNQKQDQQQMPIHALLQTQDIVMMQTHELEERIDMELMQNPALELEDPLADEEELSDSEEDNDDDHLNEDYAKPIDEYETGDRHIEDKYDIDSNISLLERFAVDQWSDDPEQLEKAFKAIDDYRISGIMADSILQEVLSDLEVASLNKSNRQTNPSFQPF